MFTDSILTLSHRFHSKNNNKVKIEKSNQQKQYNRWNKLLQITTIVFSAQFSQFTWADLLNANLLNIDPKTVNAEAWMIYDPQSKQIIAQHNADVPRAPASLTKMMVAYLTLKAIENGQIQLNQQVTVPEIVNTVQWDESQLKLEPNQQISVQELLAGLIIMSANDAALTLATLIAGNVPNFLDQMNVMANQLGMQHTHFSNPSGITMQDHLSSAHDMAILSSAIVNDTPEFLQYSKQPEFRYKDIYHEATNILLKKDLSVDGLKTGYTRAAGYNLALTAQRKDMNTLNDRRLVVVVMGTPSKQARADEAYKLLNAGFTYTENHTWATTTPSKANLGLKHVIADIPVINGQSTSYAVTMPSENTHTLSLLENASIELDLKRFDNSALRFTVNQDIVDQYSLKHLGVDHLGQSTLEPMNSPQHVKYQINILKSKLDAPISTQAMALGNIKVYQFGAQVNYFPIIQDVEIKKATWWQKVRRWFEALFSGWQALPEKPTLHPIPAP